MSGAGTPPPFPYTWAEERWDETDPEIRAIAGLAGVRVSWIHEHCCWYLRLIRGKWFADSCIDANADIATWRLTCGELLDRVEHPA